MNLNWELAKQWAAQVHALAIVEHWSHDLDVTCLTEPGDYRDVKDRASFQAFGLLQQHPAFLHDYYGKLAEFPASVEHSHADMQIVAAATFLEVYEPILGVDGVLQAYNKGVTAYRQGARNLIYLSRYDAALNSLR